MVFSVPTCIKSEEVTPPIPIQVPSADSTDVLVADGLGAIQLAATDVYLLPLVKYPAQFVD